ncbi:MAG: hypothetical protein R2991_07920 [Thermoanaerobaculia bacterium]
MSESAADFVTVFETDDPAVLPVAKSLLESSGLPHILQGEEAFGQLPVSHMGGPFVQGGMAVRFLVPAGFAEEASALFSDIDPDDDADGDEDDDEDFDEYEDFDEFEDEDEYGDKRYRDDDEFDDLGDDD